MHRLLLAVSLVALVPALAHAEPVPHSRASATVGLAMPEGEVGLEYAYVPHPNFELAVGAGFANMIGSGHDQDPLPQASIMPRARYGVGRVTLALGAGVSGGRFHDGPFGFNDTDLETTALWLNTEASANVAIADGWSAGLRFGLGKMVAHTTVRDLNRGGAPTQDCSQMTVAGGTECTPAFDDVMPYLGVMVGRSF
jgi:hypothetical protein